MAVLAAYAAGVALNNFVPANLGTFVTLLMYVAIVGGDVPRRARRLRRPEDLLLRDRSADLHLLFSQVAGSFDSSSATNGTRSPPPGADAGVIGGAVFLRAAAAGLLAVVRGAWAKATAGAAILGDLGAYVKWVLLPQMGGYAGEGRRDHRLPRRVRDPGELRLGHERARLEPARQHPLVHARGVGMNQAFNSFALELHGLDDCDRLLGRRSS